MAGIRIISKNSVFAASHKEPNRSIELTPWDLQCLLIDYSQRGLLFQKPNPSEEKKWQNNLIHHLQTSLSHTLDFFPSFAGRLATIDHGDNTVSYFIDCNNAGAEFVHAVADGVSVADIVDPVYVPEIVHSFFILNEFKSFEGTSQPLLAVQVTELDDGIFIGCTTNHSVVDASSVWHFLKSWSEVSRGFNSLSKAPVLQRWFAYENDNPTRIPVLKKEQLSNSLVSVPLQQRVFHFSRENIAKLKAKANGEIRTNRISSFQAVIAHLWRSIVRNQCLDPDEEVNCLVAVGVRARLQPPLPQEYHGNAIQSGMVKLRVREVVEQGLGHVAWQLNKMIVTFTDKKVRDFLESWKINPQLLGRRGGNNNLAIGNSPKLDVYGNDFGWGKPIAARSGPSAKRKGRITLFAGVEEGSTDIEVCLSPETFQGMGNDAEFMDAFAA